MSAPDALEGLLPTEGGEVAPAASEAGNSQEKDPLSIGAFNGVTVTKTDGKKQELKTPPTPKEIAESVSQPTNKDERHAAQKITELSEKSISLARLAVEHDENAIYSIAETDPKLAEKLLLEYDYGTENLEELLAMHENPKADPEDVQRQVQNDQRIRDLESKILDETIKRLRRDHPDLKDELEEEYRNMYSDAHFSKYDEVQKLNIARAALGKTVPQTSNQVLLDVLKTQEASSSGTTSSLKTERKQSIPDARRHLYEAGAVSEADLNKYLPENIDEILESAYSARVKQALR